MLSFSGKLGRKSKIGYLYVSFLVDEDVITLQVPVDLILTVEETQALEHLSTDERY